MAELIIVGAYCTVFMALGLWQTRSQQRFLELYERMKGWTLVWQRRPNPSGPACSASC